MGNRAVPSLPPTENNFWAEAETIKIEEKPFKKCNHEFQNIPEGAQCKKCHFGLIGIFDIREGKLFHNNKQISS